MKIAIILILFCCPVLAQHRTNIEKPSGKTMPVMDFGRKSPGVVTWQPLVEAESGDEWFYRPSDQLTRKGPLVVMWIMVQEVDKPGYAVNLWAIRCDLNQISLVQYVHYTSTHRLIKRSPMFDTDWRPIHDNTLFGETRNKVCRRR